MPGKIKTRKADRLEFRFTMDRENMFALWASAVAHRLDSVICGRKTKKKMIAELMEIRNLFCDKYDVKRRDKKKIRGKVKKTKKK